MRVFIAEKPSLARAIAAVLPGPQVRHKTHIVSGQATVVVWCAGHVLEQCMPEDYDPAHKQWRLDALPIVPDHWRNKVSSRTKDLYQTIEHFARQATEIVHAGDPDREGQLLVDEVLTQIGIDVSVRRLLIADLNPAAVKRALDKLDNNIDYAGLRDAALGRSRADWLYGLNLTRLYTLQGQSGGHSGVLSVGRVQTPVLGLVVRRDLDIEQFVSKPFYTLNAQLEAAQGSFVGHWIPGKEAEAHQDDDGRVVNRAYVAALATQLSGASGPIVSLKQHHKKDAPPLPFSLPELQKIAAKGRGLSPKKTLEIVQRLYEQYQVLTYPRSDCRYLPVEHWDEAGAVRDAIAQSLGTGHALQPLADRVDLKHRGKCWNDQKITAHHAIIPTQKGVPLEPLTAHERWVYEVVAHRYLLQFCVDREYDQTDVLVDLVGTAGSECFKARGRVETEAGWRVWADVLRSPNKDSRTDDREEAKDETTVSLPVLTEGETLQCLACHWVEKKTTPPKRFSEASLLDAMTGIARFVQDPAIKHTLKETDGLGTPATQATIMETLFQRGFLEKRKKQVFSTPLGRDLINLLPAPVTLPDMTARWEQQLARIANGELMLDTFLTDVVAYTRQLVVQGNALGALTLAGSPSKEPVVNKDSEYPCPGDRCEGRLRRIKGKNGFFWGCTEYQQGCRETRPDSRGKPGKARDSGAKARGKPPSPPAKVGAKCPQCTQGSIQKKTIQTGKNAGKDFKGCSRFPSCRYFAWAKGS